MGNKLNYTLELKLKSNVFQEHILDKRFEIGRKIYNYVLEEAYRRYNVLIQKKEYTSLMKEINKTYRDDKKQRHLDKKGIIRKVVLKEKERKILYNKLNKLYDKYGLTKFSLINYMKNIRNHYSYHIDSWTGQNVAKRVWKSVDKFLYGEGKKMKFKKSGEFNSLENATNNFGLKFKDGILIWNGLEINSIIKNNDIYAQLALSTGTIKYPRIIRKLIRGKYVYYVQLIMEGTPPSKINRHTGEFEKILGKGKVGIDIGTQTVTISSDHTVKIFELTPRINKINREKVLLQRKLDRQRRESNPNKFNSNGTIKKNNKDKWVLSKNYIKTKNEYSELYRKEKVIRKQQHYLLIKFILKLGDEFYVERMSFAGLSKRSKKAEKNDNGRFKRKKRFGKSIGHKSPGMFLLMLDDKLKFLGNELRYINTQKVKASQYNHVIDDYEKVGLKDRWKIVGDTKVQRDMYSAFIIQHINKDLESIDKEEITNKFKYFLNLQEIEIGRIKKEYNNYKKLGVI